MHTLSNKELRIVLICFTGFSLFAIIINLSSGGNLQIHQPLSAAIKTNTYNVEEQRHYPSTKTRNIRLLLPGNKSRQYSANSQIKFDTMQRSNEETTFNPDTARKHASKTTKTALFSSIYSSTSSPMSTTSPISVSLSLGFSIYSEITQRSSNATNIRSSKSAGYDGPITYIKVCNERFYIYSAFSYIYRQKAHIEKEKSKISYNNDNEVHKNGTIARGAYVLINGWKNNVKIKQNASVEDFLCCVLKKDGTVEKIQGVDKDLSYHKPWVRRGLNKVSVICRTSLDQEEIIKTTATFLASSCPTNMSYYVPVKRIEYNKINGIGVCGKVAFDSLNATRVIEWLEAARMLGATKVYTYMNNLNTNARRVMTFYENLGLVQAVEFSRPEMDKYRRTFHEKNTKTWNDKAVVIGDCQGLLSDYKYGIFIDTDEFIIPNMTDLRNSWMKLADTMLLNRRFAGVTFMTSMHLTSWPPTNQTAQLFIEEYATSTPAFTDRRKYIFIPERVEQGTCWSHSCDSTEGYQLFLPTKDDKAVIHHYRTCRELIPTKDLVKWKPGLFSGKNKTMCEDYTRIISPLVYKLADNIRDNVLYVRKILKL